MKTALPTPAIPAPDALRSAVAFLRGSRCAAGAQPGGGSDWEVASHQWGLFISWAYHRGAALPAECAPARPGGREHDLLFDEASRRWLKFTRPGAAGDVLAWEGGRFVRRPATPLQYLQRWRWGNRLFGDDARLVGLASGGRTQRIVISQPHHEGTTPDWDEVDHTLARVYGLRRLPDALLPDAEGRAYGRGRLAVFDVRPDNFVCLPDGKVIPFDVLPQVFSAGEAAQWVGEL